MTVKHLLAENPEPGEEDIRSALSSNLCRCTGYTQMYQAVSKPLSMQKSGAYR